jgi:hypothetical protein
VQICLMGEVSREKLVSLVNHLNRVCFRRKQVPAQGRPAATGTAQTA